VDKLKAELDQQKYRNAELQKQLLDLQARLDSAKDRDVQKAALAALQKAAQVQASAPATVPVPVPVTPTVPPVVVQEAKITAIANEIGLVVLSIGFDDGVREGRIYTVVRGGEPIGTVKIDRVDAKWSAGKLTSRSAELRVGDEVRAEKVAPKPGTIYHTFTPGIAALSSAEELKTIRKELDDVRLEIRKLSDRIVPAWQDQGVSVEETPEELRAHLSILRGLLVRRVREGSPAEKAGLKANDVVPDLLEAQLVQALQSGMPIHVIRQGQRVRLAGGTGR
jgi:hypothetical protein